MTEIPRLVQPAFTLARDAMLLALMAGPIGCLACATSVAGRESEPTTAEPPVSNDEAPAAGDGNRQPEPAPSNPVNDWLSRIEATHGRIKTLSATLKYDYNQIKLGDRQRRFGRLIYVEGPPPKFAVHFDQLVVNRRGRAQNRWYIFDGRYLVERHEDQTPKRFSRREVAAPEAIKKGNPLTNGDGPFVIPLPVRKDRLLERFQVTLEPPQKTDPPDTIHLHLIPKPGRSIDFVELHLWHDRESLLPVKARTVSKSHYESILWLDPKTARINEPVDERLIDTRLPTGPDWQVDEDLKLKK